MNNSKPFPKPKKEKKPEGLPHVFMIDPRICRFCRSQMTYECMNECVPEGKFNHFAPVRFERWDNPPPLPPYHQFRKMTQEGRVALIFVILLFLRSQFVNCDSSYR